MHELESVLENKTPKILWDFEIQIDHLIPARSPDLPTIYKKKKKKKKKENLPNSRLSHHSGPHCENQNICNERQVLRSCPRTKKVMEHEGDSNTNYKWCA